MIITANSFVVYVLSFSSLSSCSSNEQINCANRSCIYMQIDRRPCLLIGATVSPRSSNSSSSMATMAEITMTMESYPSHASLAILHGDDVLYRHEFGNHEPDSLMCVYSMTNILTSISCLKLMERGQLSLANTVSTYLPSFYYDDGNGNWKTWITIR